MKKLILYLNIAFTAIVFGQSEFAISENGLTPKFLSLKIDAMPKNELYKKTWTWIEENEKIYNLSVDNTIENKVIHLYSIKGNAVNLDKKYFNVKYKISISFEKGQYKFEPTEIQLSVNSKYDMGWKDLDLTNGAMYFKKEKVIRKYRSYISDMTTLLNEINIKLSSYLAKE